MNYPKIQKILNLRRKQLKENSIFNFIKPEYLLASKAKLPLASTIPELVKSLVSMRKGKVLQLTGEWQRTEELYNNVIRLARMLGHQVFLADAIVHKARVLIDMGKYNAAFKLFEDALCLYHKAGLKHGITEVYGHMGAIYYYMGDFKNTVLCSRSSSTWLPV